MPASTGNAMRWLGRALCLALLALSGSAGAQMLDALEAGGSGELWLHDDAGHRQAAPRVATDVVMQVSGLLARVHVTQRFRNPTDRWVEGIYTFPLPETAAVDRMRLHIGERVIEGQIQPRELARQTYQQAKRSGRRTALVERQRPNIFTTAAANIAPEASVQVEIAYQQQVDYRDGRFSLRFPLVVGPRYIPGTPLPTAARPALHSGADGWARATDRVPDAPLITPPVRGPEEGKANPVSLRAELDPGVPLTNLSSLYHEVSVTRRSNQGYTIELTGPAVPADRDFVLAWQPVSSRLPQAGFFYQRKAGRFYGALMLMPPQNEAVVASKSPPREIIFILDRSGSMHGASMRQARAALALAIDRLRPDDRFNVIAFNQRPQRLFPTPRPAAPSERNRAQDFLSQLTAEGGTEMRPALELALAEAAQTEQQRLRQVIFITDGAVGNEAELLNLIRGRVGSSRLFTVGIGSAPNGYFMRKAARLGRGTYSFIGKPEEVQSKMSRLLERIEQPVLTDIALELSSADAAQVYPEPLPDLYRGEPVMLAFASEHLPTQAIVSGSIGEQAWRQPMALQTGAESEAVAVLWAQRRVAALEARRRRAGSATGRDSLRDAIVKTGMQHHIVTGFTSLVAVDVTPARPADDPVARHTLKTNLPHGWDHASVFGLPQTATPAPLLRMLGMALLLMALLWGLWGRMRCAAR